MQAMIDAIEAGKLDAVIALVVSDVPGALALERAGKHDIPTLVVDHRKFKNKDDYEKEILAAVKKAKVDLICLAGYMRIVGSVLLKAFRGKMINIHPSLLPSFPGLHGQKQALDHGVKVSGATVHFVDEGCDTGPIIVQAAVPVLEHDSEESLSERILEEEHRLYVQAIDLIAGGRIRLEGRVVRILSA